MIIAVESEAAGPFEEQISGHQLEYECAEKWLKCPAKLFLPGVHAELCAFAMSGHLSRLGDGFAGPQHGGCASIDAFQAARADQI